MKILLTCLMGVMAFSLTANAEAKAVRLFRDPPKIIKPVGPPRLVAGPVAFGQVFLSQDFAYVRTATLTADLPLPGDGFNRPAFLIRGTQLYALDNGANPTWCTIIKTGPTEGCFVRNGAGYVWSYGRAPDLNPLRYLDVVGTLKADGPRNLTLSETPKIDESQPAAVNETLQISLNRGLRYRQNPCGLYFNMASARTGMLGIAILRFAQHDLQDVARRCVRGGVEIQGGEGGAVALHYDAANYQITAAQTAAQGR